MSLHCTLSLITTRTCLGAAHCILESDAIHGISYCGIFGSTDRSDCSYCQLFSKIHKHENHSGVFDDIATLIFEKEVLLSDYVKPLPLIGPFEPINEDNITVIGWGITSQESDEEVKFLSYVNVKAFSDNECTFALKHQRLCLRTEGEGPCKGDSGGPNIITRSGKHIQVGITSLAEGGNCVLKRSIATDVRGYTQWIIDHSDVAPMFVKSDT